MGPAFSLSKSGEALFKNIHLHFEFPFSCRNFEFLKIYFPDLFLHLPFGARHLGWSWMVPRWRSSGNPQAPPDTRMQFSEKEVGVPLSMPHSGRPQAGLLVEEILHRAFISCPFSHVLCRRTSSLRKEISGQKRLTDLKEAMVSHIWGKKLRASEILILSFKI